MIIRRFALVLCALAVPSSVWAQAAPQPAASNLPAAPAAAAKPDFSVPLVPPGTPTAIPPHSSLESQPAPEFCHAPAEGIYGPQPMRTAEQKETLARYWLVQRSRLDTTWNKHMPRALNDPWVRGASVTVRFAVLPTGELEPPVITLSSGRRDYDRHAIEAIIDAGPFDPLPAGVTHAYPICMTFGYNKDPSQKQQIPWDAQPPRTPAVTHQP